MGTDIHTIMQFKGETVAVDFYTGRNYRLFSILAGARGEPYNELPGYGISFPFSHGDVTVIGEDHGDAYAKVGTGSGRFWLGSHSHRFVSLNELAQVELRLFDSIEVMRFVDDIAQSFFSSDYAKSKEIEPTDAVEEFLEQYGDDLTILMGFDS